MKFFEIPFVRVVLAIILAFAVFVTASSVAFLTVEHPLSFPLKIWITQGLHHAVMLIMSLILILIISKGKMRMFGFRIGKKYEWISTILIGLLLGFFSYLIQTKAMRGGLGMIEIYPLTTNIISFVLLASIAEEVLARGLVQSVLSPLSHKGIFIFRKAFSTPTIISALISAFFSTIFFFPLIFKNRYLLAASLFFLVGFVLGLFAGYNRERTQSLIPAIIIHLFFYLTIVIFAQYKLFL